MLESRILNMRIDFPMTTSATPADPSHALGIPCPFLACTRAVYLGPEVSTITVRSMDRGVATEAFKILGADKM